MADWEDDEDAFLYGNASGPAASTSAAGSSTVKTEFGTPQPEVQNANPLLSLTEQSGDSRQDGGAGEAEMEEEDEEEDEDEEEEESDDDFQIIMDANPTNAPPSHHELARKQGVVPVKVPGPSLLRDTFRQDSLQPSASTPARRQDSASPVKPSSNPSSLQSLQPTVHATGSPVPAPSRSPPPNINDTSVTYTSSKSEDAESKPVPQPIIDVDLDTIDDKKWRKGGAHLADYFNYGFDEATWKEWAAKQHRMRKDREREKENPFHVFADRPLPEAWAALPMELKGMMMQTIMSSFNSSSGSQQQQQQQMMQGMMMGGGSMPMQGNMGMGNMNMNAMGGMPMNQQHRGMNGMPNMQGNMNMMNMQAHGMDFQGGNPGMQQQMQQNRGMMMGGAPGVYRGQSHSFAPGNDWESGQEHHDAHAPHRQPVLTNPLKRPPPPERPSASPAPETAKRSPVIQKATTPSVPAGPRASRTTSPLPDTVPKGPKMQRLQ